MTGLFLLVPVGVAMADSYDVTAKVPAPLPPDLPVIMTPDNNTIEDSPQVLITGSCTIIVPTLIVVLERDGETIGSGLCHNDGTFQIMVGLVLGDNIIKVKFMTITGESSGYGTSILLRYNPPTKPASGPSTPKVTQSPAPVPLGTLNLKLDYDFVTYTTSKNTPIKITVNGGVPPYRIFIGWGDSTSTIQTLNEPGSIIVNHLYRNVPDQTMKLVIKIEDSSGIIAQGERALVSFEKLPGEAVIQPLTTHQSNKVMAIWFASTVGVMLVATILYNGHFLAGGAHTAAKVKHLPIKKALLPRRGKK